MMCGMSSNTSGKEGREGEGDFKTNSACDDDVILIESDDEREVVAAARTSSEPDVERRGGLCNRAEKRPKLDASKEGSWECSACTFINGKAESLACGMCAVARTTSLQWAAAVSAQTSQQEREEKEVNVAGSSGVVSTWTCLKCTLVNRGTATSTCAVCEAPRRLGEGVEVEKEARRREQGHPMSTSLGFPKLGRKTDAQERARIVARFKQDRDALRGRHGGNTDTTSAVSSAELCAMARDRKQREEAREAEAAQVALAQPAPADSTQMRGEAACLAGNVVRRWDLLSDKVPVAGLEAAGLRHLACINNALQLRTPAAQLLRAQYILNPTLLRAFQQLKAKHTDHKIVHLFHGTAEANIESIVTKGFLVKHAQSGPGMIWFSRQSMYSYGFTANQGKGLQAGGGGAGWPQMQRGSWSMEPSGRMFLCALLVAPRASALSNVGDRGQDVITMTSEAACLPLYLIDTAAARVGPSVPGMMGMPLMPGMQFMPGMMGMGLGLPGGLGAPSFANNPRAVFAGKGVKLGGK